LPSEAFSFRRKDELKQMSLLELNVYVAELRRRVKWLSGAALKSLEQHLAEGVKARDEKRAQQ
jgi:hypothetical protein